MIKLFYSRQNHFPQCYHALVVILPSGTHDFFVVENPMTTSSRKSAFKIRSISTKTKMKFIGGENSSKLLFHFFLGNLNKLSTYAPKTLILINLQFKKNASFLALPSSVFRFQQNNKNLEQ